MRVKVTAKQLAAMQKPKGKAGTPPAPLEKDIQASVVVALEARGCVVVRANSGAVTVPATEGRARRFLRFNSAPGCSDLLVCYPRKADGVGVFVGMEVKRPTGRLTPKQRAFLDRVTAAGGTGVVVRSVADAMAVLDTIDAEATK